MGEFKEQIWFTRIANIEELLYLGPFITFKKATWCQICSNLLTLCTQERKRLSGHFNKCISSSPVAVPGRLIQPTQKQTWGGDFQGYLTIQPQKVQLKLKIQNINSFPCRKRKLISKIIKENIPDLLLLLHKISPSRRNRSIPTAWQAVGIDLFLRLG